MLTRKNASTSLTDAYDTVAPIGEQLVKDQKLRERLIAAVDAGIAARNRAQQQVGLAGTARRLSSDPALRADVLEMVAQLREARRRVGAKRSHKLRNVGLIVAVAAVAAAVSSLWSRFNATGPETPPVS
jgi:uncharacterized protein involved in propanediol utilization